MDYENKKLEDLIVGHLGGELEPEQEKELAAMLADSAAARALMASYMRLEGATMQLAKAGLVDPLLQRNQSDAAATAIQADLSADVTTATRSAHMWQAAFWIVAACLLVGVTWYFVAAEPSDVDGTEAIAAADPPPVARLNRVVNVEWRTTELPTAIGAALPPGRLGLVAGLVEIEFDDGATVILEGPAEFELVSADRAYLYHGKLRGVVPPGAEGFTVESAEMTIVDLGTEFGIQVEESGAAELHVFDGEVELQKNAEVSDSAAANVIQAGSAVRIDADGAEEAIDADDSSFVSPAMMTVVAEAYVDELQRELEDLQQRQLSLAEEIKSISTQIKETPELVEKKRIVKDAEHAVREFERGHGDVVAVHQAMESAGRALDKMLMNKLAADDDVRRLRKQGKKLRSEIAKLKKRIKGPRAGAGEIAEWKRQRDRATAALKETDARMAQTRKRLQKDDPQLRDAQRRVEAARRLADQGGDAGLRYRELKQRLTESKKAQQLLVRQLLRENGTLRSRRAELKIVTSRIHETKRDERDVRTKVEA